jgi:hypothetical protein
MARSGADVTSEELIGGTDLGRGRDSRMERGRNERRESERVTRHRRAARVGAAPVRAGFVLRAGARSAQSERAT